jgi:hypothetical protein
MQATATRTSVGYIRSWGGQFIVPIPDVKVYS